MNPLSFDDPKPVEKRKQRLTFLFPSLMGQIDEARGRITRSEWIERACREKLARDEQARKQVERYLRQEMDAGRPVRSL